MRRTSILLLAGLSILLAVGNVLQWRSRHNPITEDEAIGRFAQIWAERFLVTNNPGGYLRRVTAARRAAQGDSR